MFGGALLAVVNAAVGVALLNAPQRRWPETAGVSGDVRQESTHSHGAALN